jgi:hypothetical protein
VGSFKFLDESRSIQEYRVLDFKSSASGRFFKIKIIFIDHSILIAREFSSKEERNYSFHWMDKDKNLIIRWDNAPYHKNINSHPHHKHVQKKIIESQEITLEEVIQYIESQLIE